MAEFPLDPMLAKTLIASEKYGVAEQVGVGVRTYGVAEQVGVGCDRTYGVAEQVGVGCGGAGRGVVWRSR